MKSYLILFLSILLFGCGERDKRAGTQIPGPKEGERVATFAGGCFWATQEAMSELRGVNKVVCAYAGGNTIDPSYEEVGSKRTGHAESVQVYYDPKIIGFADLTKAFFFAHDPTQLNGQGPDIGSDYRSIAFYRNEIERKQIDSLIKVLMQDGIYDNIVTEVKPAAAVYQAENYHQNYFKQNRDNAYIVNVSLPKVMHMRKAVPHLLK